MPVYHDAPSLERLLKTLHPADRVGNAARAAIIVAATVDDREALEPLTRAYPDVVWVEAPQGRARQMNAGAAHAASTWLVFLHADTRLAPEWLDAIDEAERRPDVAIGCFRFALDSRAVAARVIEMGVAVRVRLLKLPYGDQALFIRRSVFDQLGGYADLPIMEDVDLVRRARRVGRLYVSPIPASTSARRWEQQGWVGRTLVNLGLIVLYALGVAPARLRRLDRRRHL